MKYFLPVFLLVIGCVFISCNKNESPGPTGPVVYMCGYSGLINAVLWQDKKETILGQAFNTTDISLSGDDVYVCGNLGFALPAGGSANAAVYWKNGILKKLGNNPSYANAICTRGNDVFVCGSAMVNNEYVAVYWKNDSLHTLGNIPYSTATDIFVENSDVYVSGTAGPNGTLAAYWKNGTLNILEPGYANAVIIDNGNLYVAGGTGSGAAYWKNGLKTNLNDSSVDTVVTTTSATGIAVSGPDVHVIGYINKINAVYWKNGVRIFLNNPAAFMNISENKNAIVVHNSDVYISFNTASYWKNGEIIQMANGYASSLAVKN